MVNTDLVTGVAAMRRFMSADYFEEQRRDMVADKTISQPLMVAVMTDLLELKPDDVVLEIGTGLG
jgi:protein-L-isoaspartate O-methyltransferase